MQTEEVLDEGEITPSKCCEPSPLIISELKGLHNKSKSNFLKSQPVSNRASCHKELSGEKFSFVQNENSSNKKTLKRVKGTHREKNVSNLTIDHFKIEAPNPQRLKEERALTSVGIFSGFHAGISD